MCYANVIAKTSICLHTGNELIKSIYEDVNQRRLDEIHLLGNGIVKVIQQRRVI